MSLSLSAIIAGFLLLGGFAEAETEPQPAESALGTPRRELLESATQVKFARECNVPLPAVPAGTPRTPPRAVAELPMPHIYPEAARRSGYEGTVKMLLLINEEGRVARALVEQSSGHLELDQAALEATEQWHFAPARMAGQAHCAWGRFEFQFRAPAEVAPVKEAPIDPEAERLVEMMFEMTGFAHALAEANLLKGTDEDRRLVLEVAKAAAGSAEVASAKREWARRWSAALTRYELDRVLEFYETYAGRKWLYTYRDFERRTSGSLVSFFGATACQSLLARRALASGKAARGIVDDGLPKEFLASLPDMLQRNQVFCACAADSFAQNMDASDPALRDTLIERVESGGPCPFAPETSW